ncbi:glycosyltransferase family 4 protein [Bizionia echini]|uniref:glycosyltransferase family 4 protein n=1 Tax=Bizionia echini TaxID=649333 RepID=UPI0030DC69C4
MKILILYTYNKGLLSNFFQELSEKLCTDGFEVFNFYLKHKKESFTQNNVQTFGEKRGNHLHNYRCIYQIISRTKPDIIISNFSYVNPALLFGRIFRVKRNIAWFHTVYGHGRPNKQKVFTKRLFLKMADFVIANSPLLQKEMQCIYKIPKHHTVAIPFWTNIFNYSLPLNSLKILKNHSTLQIGCPGRLLLDKNHASVIKAVHELKQYQQKTIKLYIAGEGPYRQNLEQLVNNLGLNNDVIFLGQLSVPEMVSFYEAMNVIVLPSFHEAFGLVFIEAIALGRPVLVSKAFGALDFIDAKKFSIPDFTFNPHDIPELIDKLESFLGNNGLESDYFKMIYDVTFQKDFIYDQIKDVILNQAQKMPAS